MRAPPTGYLEIERALRLLALGDSDLWIAAGWTASATRRRAKPRRCCARAGARQAQALLEAALARLAGRPDGNGLAWFRNAGR